MYPGYKKAPWEEEMKIIIKSLVNSLDEFLYDLVGRRQEYNYHGALLIRREIFSKIKINCQFSIMEEMEELSMNILFFRSY